MTSLLFTAPFDFAPAVLSDIVRLFDYAHQKHVVESRDLPPGDFTVWVCNPKQNFVVDETVLEKYPSLTILITPSTGSNHVDRHACANRGIKVFSLLDDRAALEEISASSEFTLKLLLDAFRLEPPREVQGKKVGLIGFGRIGRRMRLYLNCLGAEPFIYDPYVKPYDTIELAEVFLSCDGVVVCCTLTPETRGMITEDLLLSMKPSAVLVNTARGDIIDESALITAMLARPDLCVALDVVHGEETGTDAPGILRGLGAIVTPHIAGETYDSRTKAAKIVYNIIRNNRHE